MEITMMLGLFRLLFDVARWIQKDVIVAENNPDLNTGAKKHEFVKDSVSTKIIDKVDNDLREELEKLPEDLKKRMKKDAIAQINRSIEESVNTQNTTGQFATNANKGD